MELKKFDKELDEEEHEGIDTTETSPKKINTPSIKAKVNLEKDITLQMEISRQVDEKNAESVILPPALPFTK